MCASSTTFRSWHRGSRRWLLVFVAIMLLTVAGWLGFRLLHRNDQAPLPVEPVPVPVWSDEFNGPAGAAPDPRKWGHDVGGHGWGNQELEYYTPGSDNASLDGTGHLVITATEEGASRYTCWYGPCRYTSARLLTSGKFSHQYGRIEARIQVPRGQGIWPAFWALGDNFSSVGWPASGEIDIMENIGREPGTVHGSLHGPGSSVGNPFSGLHTLDDGQEFADGFHTFGIDWTPTAITWYVDGSQYSRYTVSELSASRWVFDRPFFLILNLAVGGGWPGAPDSTSGFPKRMVVDYVRCYSSTLE